MNPIYVFWRFEDEEVSVGVLIANVNLSVDVLF